MKRRGRAQMAGMMRVALLTWALAVSPPAAMKGDIFSDVLNDNTDGVLEEELAGLLAEITPADLDRTDLDRLGGSHLSYIRFWEGVAPARRGKGTQDSFAWKQFGDDAGPLSDEPIACLVNVPESGEYRVYLRYRHDKTFRSLPVRMTVTAQTVLEDGTAGTPKYVADGEPLFDHSYGELQISSAARGAELEEKLPVRFGRETDRIGSPTGGYVWEYRDVPLEAGVYRLALQSNARDARVTALFMTRSKDFRPSLSSFDDENTLARLYVRLRVGGSTAGVGVHPAHASLTFHYRGRSGDNGQPMWGAPVARFAEVETGEWSDFVDATDPALPIPGWATLNMGFGDVTNGTAEMQFAWQPREEAVLHTVRTVNGPNGARLRVPGARGQGEDQPNLQRPIWGVWLPVYFPGIESQEQVVERYARWVRESREALGLSADHPTIKGVRLGTGNGVLPPLDRQAYRMLAEMGINWMSATARGQVKSPPRDLIEQYDLYDDYYAVLTGSSGAGLTAEQRDRVALVKWGDEIQTAVSPAYINANPEAGAKFDAFLREQARMYGSDARTFYGVSDLRYVDYPDVLDPRAGRFQRRIFYAAQRYRHVAQVPDYRRSIATYETTFPNARIYNNYSPHPVFLTGLSMNHGDWFVLTRHKAQTIGWGEDWAGPPTWDLGTDYQCVSYYAALVECAARKHGYPAGFYIVLHSGGPARKIFSCIGHGVTWLRIYDWGPRDAVAEFSNAWSDNRALYPLVMTATHALGPADRIVSEGQREPRRTAILYNRSYEMWTGGLTRLNHDWMWSFIALTGDQIPVELIIEEDLNAETLARYKVLHLGGYNIEKFRMKTIRQWVENGGTLIGGSGFAVRDEYDDTMQETIDLFGAAQIRLEPDDRFSKPRRVAFSGEGSYPAIDMDVSGALFRLEPTTGKPIARYEDGGVAAVERQVGKGRAILLGMPPGLAYQKQRDELSTVRVWHNAPALRTLGRQRLEYSHHRSEAVLFEHDEGLAVLLSDFALDDQPAEAVLSIRPERDVKEVVSGLNRPLEWQRNDDRIDITVPMLEPVDVVILR